MDHHASHASSHRKRCLNVYIELLIGDFSPYQQGGPVWGTCFIYTFVNMYNSNNNNIVLPWHSIHYLYYLEFKWTSRLYRLHQKGKHQSPMAPPYIAYGIGMALSSDYMVHCTFIWNNQWMDGLID